MDEWLEEAKKDPSAENCGMFLFHNGIVRKTPKAQVRCGQSGSGNVSGMIFSYDGQKVEEAVDAARRLEGIYYVRVWLNSGELSLGDDIMLVLVGGDIRPHVVDALQFLVGKLKNECVTEQEIFS